MRSAIFSLNLFSSFAAEGGDCETYFEKIFQLRQMSLEKIFSEAIRDLYKDSKGNIYVKPKGGGGEADPTGLNIKDYP